MKGVMKMSCEVCTKSGRVRGKKEDGIYKWLGIPYAKKPIGEYRFRKAQPVEPWTGVLEADTYGNKPLQIPFVVFNPNVKESEDCLYLNIWSSGTKEKKPVVFMIFGSAYILGESSLMLYDGTSMAKDDVVFVNINHRLGVFGCFDFSHLSGNTEGFDDNVFVSDQLEALKWVKENIGAFGGDPDNITLLGESAAGCALLNLMACPAAEGLFQKVILQSAVLGSTVTPNVGNRNMRVYLEHLGIGENELYKLKEMDVKELLDATGWLFGNYSRINPGIALPGSGIIGGEYILENPMEVVAKGKAKGIKMLIGTNKDETTLFVHGEDSNVPYCKEEIEKFFELTNTPEIVREKLREHYGNFETDQQLEDFVSDYIFNYPSVKLADIQSQFADTYMYYYSFEAEPATSMGLGAHHMAEIAYALGTVDISEFKNFYNKSNPEVLKKMESILHSNWVNFIKYGNPNGEQEEPWPKYDTENRMVYEINETCNVLHNPYDKLIEVMKDFKGYE